MPQPGSRSYDVQKHRLQKSMEDQGLDKDTAEDVADDAVHRMANSGDSEPRPDLPSQISPSANPPGNKNRKPDEPAAPTVEDWESEL